MGQIFDENGPGVETQFNAVSESGNEEYATMPMDDIFVYNTSMHSSAGASAMLSRGNKTAIDADDFSLT